MFKFVVFCCIIAAAVAKPGILSSPLRIAAAPTFVSAPTMGIVRTAPAVGIVRTAPIAFNTISSGLVSHGLVSNDLISNGLVSKGVITGGLVSTKFL